jgi:hypothetical protein
MKKTVRLKNKILIFPRSFRKITIANLFDEKTRVKITFWNLAGCKFCFDKNFFKKIKPAVYNFYF